MPGGGTRPKEVRAKGGTREGFTKGGHRSKNQKKNGWLRARNNGPLNGFGDEIRNLSTGPHKEKRVFVTEWGDLRSRKQNIRDGGK